MTFDNYIQIRPPLQTTTVIDKCGHNRLITYMWLIDQDYETISTWYLYTKNDWLGIFSDNGDGNIYYSWIIDYRAT